MSENAAMSETLIITPDLVIPLREISFSFVRASGPGGQNVNKVATAVQLRFDAAGSPSLPDAVRERLLRIARTRINREGFLQIDARRYRTQERNRQDALQRLVKLLQSAAREPVRRIPTRPSTAAKQRRLQEKKLRGETKRRRRDVSPEEE